VYENQTAFARRIGVSRVTIGKAVKSGRLILSDGKLHIADSLRRWESTKPGTRPDVAARHAANRAAAIPSPPYATKTQQSAITDVSDSDEDDGPGIAHYRKVELIAAINTAKLEIALRTGERFPVADIGSHAGALGATLRASLERLVDTTAARLTLAHTNAARVELIKAETTSIRRLMTKQFVRSIRALRESAKAR
jgi:hypothetical protein